MLHERPTYAEAVVLKGGESIAVQWTCDSAYRFFPLIEHPDLGLTLHPFDSATNKTLCLVGRAEVRDWVDVMDCHRLLQPLGYLIWAACGKDPSFNPTSILDEARRSARYTQTELAELAFDGSVPDAADLARNWKGMLEQADEIVALLPPEQAGCCVLGADLELYTGTGGALAQELSQGELTFHEGRIGGAWPRFLNRPPHRHGG